jgi:hypothetical protein
VVLQRQAAAGSLGGRDTHRYRSLSRQVWRPCDKRLLDRDLDRIGELPVDSQLDIHGSRPSALARNDPGLLSKIDPGGLSEFRRSRR